MAAKLRAIMDQIIAMVPPDSNGLIAGKGLRPLLTRTEIPLPALKQVWTMADASNRGALTRDELRTLLCLIALVQQGRTNVSIEQLRVSAGAKRGTAQRRPVRRPRTTHKQSPARGGCHAVPCSPGRPGACSRVPLALT